MRYWEQENTRSSITRGTYNIILYPTPVPHVFHWFSVGAPQRVLGPPSMSKSVSSLAQLSDVQRARLREEAEDLVKSGVWRVHRDVKTSRQYFSNRETKQTTWDLERHIAIHVYGWIGASSSTKHQLAASRTPTPTGGDAAGDRSSPPVSSDAATLPPSSAPSSPVASSKLPEKAVEPSNAPPATRPPPPPPPPLKGQSKMQAPTAPSPSPPPTVSPTTSSAESPVDIGSRPPTRRPPAAEVSACSVPVAAKSAPSNDSTAKTPAVIESSSAPPLTEASHSSLSTFSESAGVRQEALRLLFQQRTAAAGGPRDAKLVPTWMRHESNMPALCAAELPGVPDPVSHLPPLDESAHQGASFSWSHECYFATGSIAPRRGVARFSRSAIEIFVCGSKSARAAQPVSSSSLRNASAMNSCLRRVFHVAASSSGSPEAVPMQCSVPLMSPAEPDGEPSVVQLPTPLAVSFDIETHIMTVYHLSAAVAALRCVGVGSHVPTIPFVDPADFAAGRHSGTNIGVVMLVSTHQSTLLGVLRERLDAIQNTKKPQPPQVISGASRVQHSSEAHPGNDGVSPKKSSTVSFRHSTAAAASPPIVQEFCDHQEKEKTPIREPVQDLRPASRGWQRHADPSLLDAVYRRALGRPLPSKEQVWGVDKAMRPTTPKKAVTPHAKRIAAVAAADTLPRPTTLSSISNYLERARRTTAASDSFERDVLKELQQAKPRAGGTIESPFQRPAAASPVQRAALIKALQQANRDLDAALMACGVSAEW